MSANKIFFSPKELAILADTSFLLSKAKITDKLSKLFSSARNIIEKEIKDFDFPEGVDAVKGKISIITVLAGHIFPDQTLSIKFKRKESITKILVNLGDAIKKGMPIAKVDVNYICEVIVSMPDKLPYLKKR